MSEPRGSGVRSAGVSQPPWLSPGMRHALDIICMAETAPGTVPARMGAPPPARIAEATSSYSTAPAPLAALVSGQGITPEALAARAGLGERHVHALAAAHGVRARMPVVVVERLARAVGISRQEVLDALSARQPGLPSVRDGTPHEAR